MEEYVYSIYTGSHKVGHVYKIDNAFVVYSDKDPKSEVKIFFDTKIDTDQHGEMAEVIADEPLRELSSQPYLINTDKDMIYNDVMYEADSPIPLQCRFMAMPVILSSQILAYTPRTHMDHPFIEQGYVKELMMAKFIFVPNQQYEYIGDLLIEKVEGDIYTSFNGKTTQLSGSPTSTYVKMDVAPTYTGTHKYTPYTYTRESLINKYRFLNLRLQKYGSERTESMLNSIKCLMNRIATDTNKFAASQIYDKVVSVVTDLR